MKKILSLLMLICFLISCERKEPNFSEEMIEKLSDRGEIKNGIVRLPSRPSSFLYLYIPFGENEIHLSNSDELFFFYKEYYSKNFKSFEEFLNAVLNEGFILNKRKFKNMRIFVSFKLNSEIKKEYLSLGFSEFLKKHSKLSVRKNQLYLNRFTKNRNEYLTIKYLLYLNRYDVFRDDMHAKDYITKREDSFK